MNEILKKEFTYLRDYHKLNKEPFQQKVYDKVLSIIKNADDSGLIINDSSYFKNIPGIGKLTIDKIDSIIKNGKLLEKPEYDIDKFQIIKKLESVYGIGPVKAEKLYNEGIRSLKELKNIQDLTHNQLLGIQYHNELQQKIPRTVITTFKNYITKLFKNKYTFEVLGSYRRGNEYSGDIDILIQSKKTKNQVDLIPIIERMYKENLILGTFGLRHSFFSGILKFKDIICSIDLKSYPKEEYPFALLYFTGPGQYNMRMRLYAKKLGLRLSDHGLINMKNGEHILCTSEKEIYDVLGLQYLEPHMRI